MGDDKKVLGVAPLETGKKFSGEKFVTVRTAADIEAQQAVDQVYAGPDAVDLKTYFSLRRINDPVKQAMMAAFRPRVDDVALRGNVLMERTPSDDERLILPRRASPGVYDAFFKSF